MKKWGSQDGTYKVSKWSGNSKQVFYLQACFLTILNFPPTHTPSFTAQISLLLILTHRLRSIIFLSIFSLIKFKYFLLHKMRNLFKNKMCTQLIWSVSSVQLLPKWGWRSGCGSLFKEVVPHSSNYKEAANQDKAGVTGGVEVKKRLLSHCIKRWGEIKWSVAITRRLNMMQ